MRQPSEYNVWRRCENVGENVAKELKLDKVYTELLPADKVEKVEELMKEKSEKAAGEKRILLLIGKKVLER